MDLYRIESTSNHESASYKHVIYREFKDGSCVRDWIINHLDCSRSWKYSKVK